MKKLFGTDGIRGKAYQKPLDGKTLFNLGRVVSKNLKGGAKFLIGMDPRESSNFISLHIFSGLKSLNFEPHFLGVLSTPSLSWLTKNFPEVEMSVMVSASHNPYEDNGLKFFSRDGTKLSDEKEEILEKMLEEENEEPIIFSLPKPRKDFLKEYENWLNSLFKKDFLKGLKIVVDTANGALSNFAQKIFKNYGAKVFSIGSKPNGKNINDNVGSQFPQKAKETLKKNSADIGICFDGDGDRVLFILPPEKILDGDHLLYLLAKDLKEKKLLGGAVVATEMSNKGLEIALKKENIKLIRTKVGDRYVFEEMKRKNLILGGEQSGHIVLKHLSNTGDGLLVALHILEILIKNDFKIDTFKNFPQKTLNFRVMEKIPLEKIKDYQRYLNETKKILKEGRIFIRYSGTEPLLRVMLEAPDEEKLQKAIEKTQNFFKEKLNEK